MIYHLSFSLAVIGFFLSAVNTVFAILAADIVRAFMGFGWLGFTAYLMLWAGVNIVHGKFRSKE